MLADVGNEAEEIVRNDGAFDANPKLRDAVLAAVKIPDGAPPESWVAHMASLEKHVASEYVELARLSLLRHFTDAKPSLVSFETTLEQLASHGRALGWSDEGLIDIWEQIANRTTDPAGRIIQLCAQLPESTREYKCSIRVKLDNTASELFNLPHRNISIHTENNETSVDILINSHDAWTAARTAFARVSALICAPNVFQGTPNSISHSLVQVHENTHSINVDASNQILRDHHNPRRDQIKRIVEVASRADGLPADTLYDAIRNHQRALTIPDAESAFVLLWTALERLCADPARPEPILSTTADLISGSIAFSKVRREVGNFSDELTAYLKSKGGTQGLKLHEVDHSVIRSERSVISHDDILRAMIGSRDEAKTFCAAFYEDVRLTQWFFRLRRQFASQSDTSPEFLQKKLPRIIEGSRKRTRWQVLRLYRARNSLAHGASWPLWLTDLVRHANFLLTNAIAICLNYASPEGVSAKSMLKQRCGWLDAYLSLVRVGEPNAVSLIGMLKPSQLFSRN